MEPEQLPTDSGFDRPQGPIYPYNGSLHAISKCTLPQINAQKRGTIFFVPEIHFPVRNPTHDMACQA